MSTRIPLELSSTLDASQQAALLLGASAEVTPYSNETPTAEKAPVLVSIAANRTVDADEFAKLMLENGNQGTLPQARLVVNAVAAVLARLAGEYGAVTVQTPFGTVQTFVAGSVENPQDAADADANYAWLGVSLPEPFRRTVAAIETYVPSGACPAALKRIRDKATNAPRIVGTGEFYLEGLGLTFGRSDETLELWDAGAEAKVCDVAVAPDPAPSAVQFVCNLPRTVASGRYTLRLVTSAGGDRLWPLTIKADVAGGEKAPQPLAVSRLKSTMFEAGDTTWFQHADTAEADAFNTVTGTGFGDDLAARILLKDAEGQVAATAEVSDLTRTGAGEFTFKLFEPQSRPPDGDWEDGPVFLEVAGGGERVEFPVAFANPASN